MEGHRAHFLHLLAFHLGTEREKNWERGFESQNWKIPTALVRTGNNDVMAAVTGPPSVFSEQCLREEPFLGQGGWVG